MSTAEILATNVRIFRAARNLTQALLAEEAGISPQYVAKIERGDGNVTLVVLDQLAQTLKVTPARLVTEVVLQSQAA